MIITFSFPGLGMREQDLKDIGNVIRQALEGNLPPGVILKRVDSGNYTGL
jgi:hypothetical protein